jgi:hypothetical protein
VTVGYPSSTEATAQQTSAPASRRGAFIALALFILLGPAPGQLLGLHSPLFREWIMFSAAGVGLPKGHFTLHRADGAVTMTPLEVLGLPSYLALPLKRRIYQATDLKAFAGRICDDSREKARLSFEGSIGTFDGWRALTIDDVCDVSAQTSNGRP